MDKTGLTEITATVLQQTKNSIEGMCEVSGLSIGEIIDRMILKWSAKDPEHATQLILDDMVIHTKDLSPEDFNLTVYCILAVIKRSLSKDEPEAIKKVIDEIEQILKDKMVDADI